jgi:hypothetical protein
VRLQWEYDVKPRTSRTIVCVASLLLAGCAGFRSATAPVVADEDLRVAIAEKIKVYYVHSYSANIGTPSDKALVKILQRETEAIAQQFAISGCCELVDDGAAADIVVTGNIDNYCNPAAMVPAFITGLSFYTIPSWATIKDSYTVDVKTASGRAQSYQFQDQVTLVQWLPMLFAFPFANPFEKEKEMRTDMYRSLIVDMKKDGLFDLDQ